MWFLLFTVPFLVIAADVPSAQECFDEAATKYIICKPVNRRPAVCDCTLIDPCYIKMIVTRQKNNGVSKFNYLINQTFQGPTIMVKHYGIVVIDVSNEMDEDTSIHFHGMRQKNVPWMDGVGNITQYTIPANGRFRYIIRAEPHGTHWYHAHMRYQRANGLFGVLIVIETQIDLHEKLGPFEDQPERKTIPVVDRMVEKPKQVSNSFCLPDGSNLPIQFISNYYLIINSVRLAKNVLEIAGNGSYRHYYYVVGGTNYRFRIICATMGTVFVMSIDHHKMYVMAVDGYPVKPFETDFLIMHVGEVFDFILKAKKDALPGSIYPIRIQSLAVNCTNSSELAGESFAFLVYTNKSNQTTPPTSENLIVQNDRCNNQSNPCTIMNCPFKIMPTDYSRPGTYMKCYDVLSLELLYPTPNDEIPSSDAIASEYFFNLEGVKPKASIINGIKFLTPDVPLLERKGASDECKYPVKCKVPGNNCTHTVYLTQFNTATRFVISSINQGQPGGENLTHPIHMHSHTYFIAKIGYPEYHENGTLKAVTKDLSMYSCGPSKWKNGTPEGVSVTSTTIRKSTVMVPASGYVVVHFFQDNPGYWLMHCHTDWHLNDGMNIAIAENPEMASTPPKLMNNNTKDFCFSVKTFISKEAQYPGNRKRVVAPNPKKLWNPENDEETVRLDTKNAENYDEVDRANPWK